MLSRLFKNIALLFAATAVAAMLGLSPLGAQGYTVNSCEECSNEDSFKRFREEITITLGGGPWTIIDGTVEGLYDGPTGVTLVTGDFMGGGPYTLTDAWRDSGESYSLQVRNMAMTDTLTITPSESCEFPDDRIYGDYGVCINTSANYYLNIPIGDIATMTWEITPDNGGASFQENGMAILPNDSNRVTVNWEDMVGIYELTATGFAGDNLDCPINASLMIEVLDDADMEMGMACNDLVHISLEEDCCFEVTPDLILEGMLLGDASYDVVIRDPDDYSILPNAKLTNEYLGEKLIVSVEHGCSENSCWGYILVEDKMPPDFEGCFDGFLPDVTISCTDDPTPGEGFTDFPVVFDNCEMMDENDLSYTDEVTIFFCEDDYDSMIKRTWMATDSYGNLGTCMELIYVMRTTLDEIEFPEDITLYCDVMLVNNEPVPVDDIIYLENGKPSPETTGKPGNVSCKNILYEFQDVCFDICGNGQKVYRTWSVIDWCEGEESIDMQIIKILDVAPPIVVCIPDTLTYRTDPGLCTATIERLPDPQLIADCSNTSYTIAYKLRDENGDPFDSPITDNVIDNGDGTWGITGLPLDTVWIVYTVTDDCGNSTQCFSEIRIVDEERPSAVCEKHTIVSLDDTGYAKAYAESLDDHSYDNCAIDRYEAKRAHYPEDDHCHNPEDFEFDELLHFCCEDLGKEIKVVFRVYDVHDNFSECYVYIKVQDKFPPQITCPPADITLDCDDDYTDLDLTGGMPQIEDNCPNQVDISYVDHDNRNACGAGTVTRVWSIDDGAAIYYCYQTIILKGSDFDHHDIHFPPDTEIYGCSPEEADPYVTGKPYIPYGKEKCTDIQFTYDDQLLYNFEGKCMKLLRTWIAIDWCEYNAYDPYGSAYWTHVQKILLSDHEPPEFTSECNDVSVDSNLPNCEGYITLKAHAVDNCSDIIHYSYELDIDYKPYYGFESGPILKGYDASGIYPTGTHRIRFYAEDICGNESTCEFNFTITDGKPPTPACIGKISFPLQYDYQTIIWASEFDASSYDNCDGTDLIFSFSSNTSDQSRGFDCDDLVTNGTVEDIPVEVWVTDNDGNQSYCHVIISLADNKDICPDHSAVAGNVSGLITNENGNGIDDLEVILNEMEDQMEKEAITGSGGTYSFEDLPLYKNYKIQPKVETFLTDGVSTLDLVLMQRHIMQIKPLNSPYKIIAADVNNSGSVSAIDLLILRKLILGVAHEFDNNESWRFVDAQYEFPDPVHPFGFPEYKMFESLFLGDNAADFVALKIGDVNSSASLNHVTNPEVRSSEKLKITMREENENEIVKLTFRLQEESELAGLQTTIKFQNEDFEYIGMEGMSLELSENNLGLHRIRDGYITLSWNEFQPLSLEIGTELFALILRKTTNNRHEGTEIDLNSEMLASEAYDNEFNVMDVELHRELGRGTHSDEFMLFQNVPNPFSNETSISFHLPENGTVKLEVYDLQGRSVHVESRYFNSGNGKLLLNLASDVSPGLYYYQLSAGNHKETRKMMIIH